MKNVSSRTSGSTKPNLNWVTFLMLLLIVIYCAHGMVPAPPEGEKAFLDASRSAMNKMMAGMDLNPSGNADRDFAAMMIPHHQGAIDMAKAELLYGRDEQLRRIAQEIVVEQQQEIAAMRLAPSQQAPASGTPSAEFNGPRPSSITKCLGGGK
jgi:Domain of unknown function (DUF305)